MTGPGQPSAITTCVFARPPLPGAVKTRLAADVGAEEAAAIAEALVHDALEALHARPWARVILATTALPFPLQPGLEAERWVQPEGGLDRRIEALLRRGVLASGAAMAIGADTLGLDGVTLDLAAVTLGAGRPVLGPAVDGGFWLLGLPAVPEGLLAGVPWSDPQTGARTLERIRERVGEPLLLPVRADLDVVADLWRLVRRPELRLTNPRVWQRVSRLWEAGRLPGEGHSS